MKVFGLFLSFTLFFFFFFSPFVSQANHYDSNFTRPPPRPDFIVSHGRPKFHPQQVHVSLAGKDHMRITYTTDDMNVASIVEYGNPKRYDRKTAGGSTSYRFFFYNSGKIHHVKIGPLQPNTIYYYRCGGYGDEFSFRIPPSTFPVEFAVAGDLGQPEWTLRTLDQISKRDFDVFLLPGDLSYADTHQTLWDSFGRLMENLASTRPWMVTEGNHEIESIPAIEHPSFQSYNARWLMPHAESLSQSNLYYSFDVTGVHTIMLGSYTRFDSHSDQYRWLEADLRKVDRKTTPWLVVVVMHTPWYSTNNAHKGEGEKMRKAIEDLLFRAEVNVVFAGHIHTYERFRPIFNKKADPCGPIHITIGDGGNREGLAKSFKKPQSPLSEFRESSFGHGRLRIIDNKRSHWSWHRNNDNYSVIADQVSFESPRASSHCLLNRFRYEL